ETAMASGVPLSAKDEGAFQTMAAGAFFTSEADDTCLLTNDFAKRLVADGRDVKTLIGQPLVLIHASGLARAEGTYRIAGIIDREPGPNVAMGGGLTGVMLPLAKARALSAQLPGPLGALSAYSSLTVKVTRAQSTQDVEARIKTLGFQAFSINDALAAA